MSETSQLDAMHGAGRRADLPLVAPSLSTGHEPQDALDDKVGYEPPEMRALDPWMHVSSLEQVLGKDASDGGELSVDWRLTRIAEDAASYRDEAVDGQLAIELDSKQLKAIEHLGER